MKKIILILALIFFASPALADGPVCVDAVYDAALAYFENADRIFIGPNYQYGSKLGEVTIDGDDVSPVNGGTDGRALQIEAQSITASGTGTADTMGIYDVDTTTVWAYWPITEKSITSGAVYTFATASPITIRDITETP